jgi:hypothetical protein
MVPKSRPCPGPSSDAFLVGHRTAEDSPASDYRRRVLRSNWFSLAPTLATALVCSAGFVVGGVGLALCLLALIAIAALLQSAVPPLSGPVRWAASTIIFAAYVVGAPWAVTWFTHGPLQRVTAVSLLLIPSVISVGLLLWSKRRRNHMFHSPTALGGSTLAGLALSIMAIPMLLRTRSGSAGFTWAMSGDSRNHLMAARAVLDAGGFNLDILRTYPSGVYGILALVLGANGRADRDPATLLTQDMEGLSGVWVLAALGLGVLSATAVILSLPSRVETSGHLSGPVGIVVFSSGLIVGTGLFAGVALQDGFLTAFAGEVLLMSGVVLTIRALQHPHPLLGIVLLGDVGVLATYRPLLTPILLALLVAVSVRVVAGHGWSRGWSALAGAIVLLVAAFGAYVLLAGGAELRSALEAPGSIAAPHPWLLATLGLVAIALTLGPRADSLIATTAPVLVVLACVWLLARWADSQAPSQPTPGLSYSAVKLVWAGCMIGVWVIFALIARMVVHGPEGPAGLSARGQRLAQACSLSLAAVATITIASPVGSPVPSMLNGTSRPTPEVIDALLANLHSGSLVVPWLYTEVPGVGGVEAPDFANDRLGIFWSMTQWGGLYPEFYDWAYTSISDGNAATLCPLVKVAPRLVVLTRDPELSQREQTACGPTGNVRFIVEGLSAG